MNIRTVAGFLLIFAACVAHCADAQWLTQIIAEREGGARQEAPQKTQTTGFWKTHGLILFYGSQCPHCRAFAPTLKHFAESAGADVLALSFDNQPLPEFPRFLPATTEWVNAAFGGSAIRYPALFVMHPKTDALYPVGFGAMSDDEIRARMAVIVPKIVAYEAQRSGA